VKVHVFVEGGGDQPRTLTECRKGFRLLFERALGDRSRPGISACGSRQEAYKDFCRSIEQNPDTFALLLVDAEDSVAEGENVWTHLKKRDAWRRPASAQDNQAHLMVQCMEAWFLADPQKLVDFYGHGFKRDALRRNPQVEAIAKQDVMECLERATRDTEAYHKTRHAFAILATLDPATIRQRSPHAEELFSVLLDKLALPAEE
jgi:hypothetical protein